MAGYFASHVCRSTRVGAGRRNCHAHDWQYGVASSLNRFLLKTNQQSYVRFIEGLKEGLKWPVALQQAYNGTPEQLVAQYGQSIGLPDLRP